VLIENKNLTTNSYAVLVFEKISNYYLRPKILEPNIKTKINSTKKMKNKILAIEAAPAAIPVKPKIAAIIAIIKNMAAHLSIK
jgi:hypothetical protein